MLSPWHSWTSSDVPLSSLACVNESTEKLTCCGLLQGDVMKACETISLEGRIYSTIDEEHFCKI